MDHFLNNGASLFTRDTDPEVTLMWFDDTKVVLEYMGCPPKLWCRWSDYMTRMDLVVVSPPFFFGEPSY